MTTKEYTPYGSMGNKDMTFIVIKGKDYHYCYESHNHDDNYNTRGFKNNDRSWFGTGQCVSFVRGRS